MNTTSRMALCVIAFLGLSTAHGETRLYKEFAQSYLRENPKSEVCRSQIENLDEKIHEYSSQLRYSLGYGDMNAVFPQPVANLLAKNLLADIRASFENIQKKRPDCYQKVASFYAIASYSSFAGSLEEWGATTKLLQHLNQNGKLVALPFRTGTTPNAMYGAYQCLTSTLYFDPMRAPFDMAATMNHELSHFFADKFFEPPDDDQVRATTIVDEVVAALRAGTLQTTLGPRLSVDFDRNLFDPAGPLVSLIMDRFSDRRPTYFPKTDTQGLLSFARSNPTAAGHLDQIFNRVESAYFPDGKAPSLVQWRALDPRFFNPAKAYSCGKDENVRDCFLRFRDVLNEKLSAPSSVCLQLVEQMRAGKLSGYIGSKIHLPEDESPTDGKPADEGGQPGNEGGKPGNEGGKPALGTRPCIFLGHGF